MKLAFQLILFSLILPPYTTAKCLAPPSSLPPHRYWAIFTRSSPSPQSLLQANKTDSLIFSSLPGALQTLLISPGGISGAHMDTEQSNSQRAPQASAVSLQTPWQAKTFQDAMVRSAEDFTIPTGPSLHTTTTSGFLMVLVHGSDVDNPDTSPDLPFYSLQVTTLTEHQAHPALTDLWSDKQMPLCHQKSQASSLPHNKTLCMPLH